jgi:hypothetical protein
MQPTRYSKLQIMPTRGELTEVLGAHPSLTVDGNVVALKDALTSVFQINLGLGGTAGGIIVATIEAGNGTDVQALTQILTYAAVRKGAISFVTITELAPADAKALSLGTSTLTATWQNINPSPGVITMQLTPASSLTPETMYDVSFFVLAMNGQVTGL